MKKQFYQKAHWPHLTGRHAPARFTRQFLLPLLLLCFTSATFAQISGRVIDKTGEELIGVNILVKGTTLGTVTDYEGKYAIKANPGDVLVFSYTGYTAQEVTVADGQTTMDIELSEGLDLEEIVVVGFGTQRKVDLTGAVGSIGAAEIAATPVLSADQALRGRLSGVQLSNRSGAPGAPINVRIRGVGTTGNNQPLWVVDGVPIVQTTNITVNTAANTESNPLVGINPSDIESIDVLKDASAAAIYGARAANGVIIVTTKRGKEGRTSMTYDGYVGFQSVRQKLDVLDVGEYIALQNELGRDFSAFNGQPFINWQDEVFKPAGMQSHNISASGGTERMNFAISGGYFNQEGIELATAFERYSVKANADIKVGDRIKIGESINVAFTDRLVQSEPGRAPAFTAAQNAPFVPVFDRNGDYTVPTSDNAGPASGAVSQIIGVNDLENNETRVNTRRILGSIYGELEIMKNLKFKTQFGLDYSIGQGSWFNGIYDFGGGANNASILKVVSKPTELTTNIANTLTYTNSFDRHDLNVVLGHEETNFEFDRLRGQGRGFLSPAVTLVNTAATSAVGQEADQWALRGFLGRIAYTFDRKYLVTINGRLDATSRFAKDNRSDFFPSVSVGWRLSEEPFLQNNNFIDELKIRLAWGQSGNQFTGTNFAYLSTLGLTSLYPLGASQAVQAAPTPFVFANPNLKWEVSTQTGLGIDVRLLEGKIDFSLDLFRKETSDILVGVPISAVSGFLLPPDVNAGRVRNSGVEFSALYQNRVGKLGYNISGNITAVKNEVLELGDNETPIISGYFGNQTHRTQVGESIGHFFGYKTDGIYQTDAEADAALPDESSSGVQAGDIRFVDTDGDGSITPLDRVNLGSPQPSVFYGLNLGFDFYGFDIGIFMQGASGLSVFNNVRRSMESMNGLGNQFASVADRWTPSNPSNTIPRATTTDENNNNRFSDRWVESANYLRLQNIQIGYTVNSSTIEKLGKGFVQGLRLYVSMTNLATFTPYSGLDPEVTRGFSFQKGEQPLASGQDDGFTPAPRIVQVGARVNF